MQQFNKFKETKGFIRTWEHVVRFRDMIIQEAQKLIELATYENGRPRDDVDLAAILQQHPDLIAGLNEYIKWRDAYRRNVRQDQKTNPIGHGMSSVLKDLKPRK